MGSLWRNLGWLTVVGVLGIGVIGCTDPPTFSETPNHFLSFNPVYLDSLPGMTEALFQNPLVQIGTYDEQDRAVIYATAARFKALPRLWAYQLWAISRNGDVITAAESTPKFLWDPFRHVAYRPDATVIDPRKFNFQVDLTQYDELVLTIEPFPDYFVVGSSGTGARDDTMKIEIVEKDELDVFTGLTPEGEQRPDLEFLKVGDLRGSGGQLTMRFPVAEQFDTASGTYFLANFTAETAVLNEANYGVWFGVYDLSAEIFPSLSLPALPENWVYEAWVVPPSPNPEAPLSTGRFRDPAAADASDLYAGPSSSFDLNIPGEDFLANPPNAGYVFPLNLVSLPADTGWVYITVEPNYGPFSNIHATFTSPDITPGPFFYRILQGQLPNTDHAPEFDPLQPELNTLPLVNMHGLYPRYGHPGAPLVEVTLTSQ